MVKAGPDLTVHWRFLEEGDAALHSWRCLYLWLEVDTDETLYLGIAGDCTVAERLRCRSKQQVWARLNAQGRTGNCRVLVGEITLHTISRYSPELLLDIEGLLIREEIPRGNKQRLRGTWRPGLRVACAGAWPGSKRLYIDSAVRSRRAA